MKKRLGDYIQEYSVRNKSGEDIPVYSITNSQGFCRDYFSKEVASKDKTSYKIVPRVLHIIRRESMSDQLIGNEMRNVSL